MNLNLKGKNKKDIITIGILILSLILLFLFVYSPKSKEVAMLSTESKKIKHDIDELYNFIGGEKNFKDNIIKVRMEVAGLEGAIPSERELSDIIKQLNEEARRFKIDVSSIKPKDIEIYKDTDGKELMLLEYFCKCMPLHLSVEARYRALGEFLGGLEANKKPLISVMHVEIKKDDSIVPKIRAEIDIAAYILGK